ncbi:MAG: ArdC family protein, partial [Synergistaceae bacterium]|nr:ArdC family protein [Synergistaceae bacterium]
MISSKAQEYRDELVKKLCEAMENGTAPWQKTWTDGDAPFNAVSGRAYHGINLVNLALQSQTLGHPGDPRWITFDQAKEKGWHVKQGEKGTHVEFYKFDEKPKFDESGAPVLDADGKQEVEKSVLVRNYVVFHASQIEGIPPYEPKARNPIEANEKAERILKESGA